MLRVHGSPCEWCPIHVASDGWDYDQGGDDWPGLCATGTAQSPINIISAEALPVMRGGVGWGNYSLELHYQPASNLSIVYDGHTLLVPDASSLGFLNSGGALGCGINGGASTVYNVLQLHFHTPSEHAVDGKLYDAELHIVHQKQGATGKNDLLVIGIFFSLSGSAPDHPFLKILNWDFVPTKKGGSVPLSERLDLTLFPAGVFNQSYFGYQGSLTTPTPTCVETVTWRVFKTAELITQKQLSVLQQLFPKGNNRNTQPVHERLLASVSQQTC